MYMRRRYIKIIIIHILNLCYVDIYIYIVLNTVCPVRLCLKCMVYYVYLYNYIFLLKHDKLFGYLARFFYKWTYILTLGFSFDAK